MYLLEQSSKRNLCEKPFLLAQGRFLFYSSDDIFIYFLHISSRYFIMISFCSMSIRFAESSFCSSFLVIATDNCLNEGRIMDISCCASFDIGYLRLSLSNVDAFNVGFEFQFYFLQ